MCSARVAARHGARAQVRARGGLPAVAWLDSAPSAAESGLWAGTRVHTSQEKHLTADARTRTLARTRATRTCVARNQSQETHAGMHVHTQRCTCCARGVSGLWIDQFFFLGPSQAIQSVATVNGENAYN